MNKLFNFLHKKNNIILILDNDLYADSKKLAKYAKHYAKKDKHLMILLENSIKEMLLNSNQTIELDKKLLIPIVAKTWENFTLKKLFDFDVPNGNIRFVKVYENRYKSKVPIDGIEYIYHNISLDSMDIDEFRIQQTNNFGIINNEKCEFDYDKLTFFIDTLSIGFAKLLNERAKRFIDELIEKNIYDDLKNICIDVDDKIIDNINNIARQIKWKTPYKSFDFKVLINPSNKFIINQLANCHVFNYEIVEYDQLEKDELILIYNTNDREYTRNIEYYPYWYNFKIESSNDSSINAKLKCKHMFLQYDNLLTKIKLNFE